MTYGGHYGKQAKGAINRFYEHADARHLATLQECTSELYLATGEKSRDKLWSRVDLALGHLCQGSLKLDSLKAKKVVEGRNVEALAALVTELSGKR